MPITQKTLSFLQENMIQNSKEWYDAHKDEYRRYVEGPMLALSEELGETVRDLDPLIVTTPRRTLSRVRRDTRFSRDKTLYREVMWLAFHRGAGMAHPSLFFEMSPKCYRYGCGYYAIPTDVMVFIRKLVLADDKRYLEAQKALDAFPDMMLEGERYKRPRFADQPEPKRKWLECKSFYTVLEGKDPAVLFSENLGEILADAFRRLASVYRLFLSAHLTVAEENE